MTAERPSPECDRMTGNEFGPRIAQTTGGQANPYQGKEVDVKDDSGSPSLQEQVADYHKRRFPKAKPGHAVIKAVAELGELAEALLDGDEYVSTHRSPPPDVLAEAADVVITMLALIGRFYPGTDLMGAVAAKLAILDDPDGTHRSSIGAMA